MAISRIHALFSHEHCLVAAISSSVNMTFPQPNPPSLALAYINLRIHAATAKTTILATMGNCKRIPLFAPSFPSSNKGMAHIDGVAFGLFGCGSFLLGACHSDGWKGVRSCRPQPRHHLDNLPASFHFQLFFPAVLNTFNSAVCRPPNAPRSEQFDASRTRPPQPTFLTHPLSIMGLKRHGWNFELEHSVHCARTPDIHPNRPSSSAHVTYA
ncbi:hypothetical protein QBC45DRAFT_195992 [Copromyces sp. CBS 386.78]|nr:hypothetical protein QBC45DRAFT_195992 [Copromyces sp. CBS 386.78]